MLLIDKAHQIEINEGIHFEYFCLLSGQDYLTKPIEYINERLEMIYPKALIDCCSYEKGTWLRKKFVRNPFGQRINKWLRFSFNKRNVFWYVFKAMERIIRKISQIFRMTDYHYFKRKDIDLFGGSAWWILPDTMISFVSNEYKAKKKQWERLLFSETPEEVFFQTMAMQSSAANDIQLNIDKKTQKCKTWSYFYDDDKPPVNHPYTFTVKEFNKLIEKDCWFARKFDMNEDSVIFDLLDEYSDNFLKVDKNL